MKALRTLTILFALALMCLPAPSAAAAEKPFKLDICAMPEHESFIFWYAKEHVLGVRATRPAYGEA